MSPENGKQALPSGDRILSAVDIAVFRFLAQTLGNFLEHYPSTGLVLSDRLKYQLELQVTIGQAPELADPAEKNLALFALREAASLLADLYRLREDLNFWRTLFPGERSRLDRLYGFINDACRFCQEQWSWCRFLGHTSQERIRFLFLRWGEPSLFALLDWWKKRVAQVQKARPQESMEFKFLLGVSEFLDKVLVPLARAQEEALHLALAPYGFGEEEIAGLLRAARQKGVPARGQAAVPWQQTLDGAGQLGDVGLSLQPLFGFSQWSRHLWNDFIARLWPIIRKQARRWFPRTDPEILDESIADALLVLKTDFDPSRPTPIRAFLWKTICNCIRNKERARGRQNQEIPLTDLDADYEDFAKKGKKRKIDVVKSASPDRIYEGQFSLDKESVQKVLEGLSEKERAEAELLARNAPVEDWIEHFGWKGPEKILCKRVYRAKDRLCKKLRRRLVKAATAEDSQP